MKITKRDSIHNAKVAIGKWTKIRKSIMDDNTEHWTGELLDEAKEQLKNLVSDKAYNYFINNLKYV